MACIRRVIPAIAAFAIAVLFGPTSRPAALAQSAPDSVSIALTGDSILTRRVSVYQDPASTGVFDLVRRADAAFTNLETLFHDYESWPAHESGGTWMRSDPALVKELTWAGFDIVSRANNHAGDFGVATMQATSKVVRDAGLVEAGVGASLTEAREARFLETPRARIALVSAASTFTPHSRAGNTRGDMPARPGLSPLRFTTMTTVTAQRMEELRRISAEVNGRPAPTGDTLNFFGRQFIVGPTPGIRTEPNKEDVAEIGRVIKSASTLADLVIVSLHCHENGRDRTIPADFIATFAHAVIDAGADIFVGHGPHLLRGVEIYKGKPIFYSLANFIFQNESVTRFPEDSYEEQSLGVDAQPSDYLDKRYDNDRRSFPADREYWESVVAMTRWQGRKLTDITLHPITLGFGLSRGERGRPMLATADAATRILQAVDARSKTYGTRVKIDGSIGSIELGASSNQQIQR